ncbi:MAG: hypothetical protein A2234_03190 [Elusimicrobia bacterium RIFOXYA2_FULL_58_8]|nr:MAG: hypothetical protein A2234_03190 [Elusimicrobia bacterium RIFOXYA2_FULL_58_8]
MEKALLLSPSEAERIAPDKALHCPTFIIGSEFCQNQVPSLPALKRLAHGFPKTSLVLATSLMTDKGLRRWERLLGALPRGLVSQIIVNDWGLLPAAGKKGLFTLSIGRLLAREFVRMDRTWAAEFCKTRRVEAVEADTPELAATARTLRLKISWHRPLGFTAVTTFCPFEKHFSQLCSHSCEGRLLKLANHHLPQPLFLGEKAYFSPLKSPPSRSGQVWREVWTLNFLRNAATARS